MIRYLYFHPNFTQEENETWRLLICPRSHSGRPKFKPWPSGSRVCALQVPNCNVFLQVPWNWNEWSFPISPDYSRSQTIVLLSGLLLSNLSPTQLLLWFTEKETYRCYFLPQTLQNFCIPCRTRSKCLSPEPKSPCVGRSLLQSPQCHLPAFTLQQQEMRGGSSKHSMVSCWPSETHKLVLFCMGRASPTRPQSLIPSRKYLLLITEIPSDTKLSSEPHILPWVVCPSLH